MHLSSTWYLMDLRYLVARYDSLSIVHVDTLGGLLACSGLQLFVFVSRKLPPSRIAAARTISITLTFSRARGSTRVEQKAGRAFAVFGCALTHLQ